MNAGSGVEAFGPEALTKGRGEVGSREHGTATGGEVGKGALDNAIELRGTWGSQFECDRPGGTYNEFFQFQVVGSVVAADEVDNISECGLELLEFVEDNSGKLALCLVKNTELHAGMVVDDESPVAGTSNRFVTNVAGVNVDAFERIRALY